MFNCYLPKLEFGNGIINSIGKYAKDMGSKAIVVIDPFIDSTGLGDNIITQLKDSGINAIKYSDIQPNPNCFKVDEASMLARDEKCEFAVAVGGGSVIDFGKGVAVISGNTGNCWEYTERADHRIKRPGKSTLPVIAVPTTAGTGSEVTPFAVFNNPEIKEKSTIVSDRIYPEIALVDPELMATMPAKLTASTGFDAFSHALESYISLNSTPFSTMVAREAMSIIVKYLPEVVLNGNNSLGREKLAWGSTLAGAAIAQIGVTLPHALGQPISGLYGAPHGESVAACMVKVIEFSYLSDKEKFADIAQILNPGVSKLGIKQKAEKCSYLVEKFLGEIGLEVRFSDFGMSIKDVDQAAKIALAGYYFDIKCHPRKVTEEEIKQLYIDCL